jgi:hypothetical protein
MSWFRPSPVVPVRAIGPSKPKLRVLYVLDHYPELSESYIQTEIRILGEEYEIFIVSAQGGKVVPNPEGYPFTELSNFNKLVKLVREVRPQVMHTHVLCDAKLLARLSDATGIPFTIRGHSCSQADVPRYIHDLHQHLNDDRCLGLVILPYTREVLTTEGKVRPEKMTSVPPVLDFGRFYDRSPNQDGVMNLGPCLAKKKMTDFIDVAARFPGRKFSLYPLGHMIKELKAHNRRCGSPVIVEDPKPHSAIPAEYKRHNWLLYTGCFRTATLGWPMSIVEAKAAGVVVCVANVRKDIKEYVSESGYVYNTLDEAAEIISSQPPAAMREAAFDHASSMDLRKYKHLLTDLWHSAGRT